MSSLKNKAIETALAGNWTQAISLNKELLDDNPKDVEALNRIGLAYTVLGKFSDARSAYQKVLEIDSLNSIALKNLRKFTKDIKVKNVMPVKVNNIFLEASGKTKVVELLNLAPNSALSSLKTGQLIELSIKRSKIFVLNDEKKYIGMLPDDVGRRLIKFIAGGNQYEAYTRSIGSNNVTVFIRELKRATKFKNLPSFMTGYENTLEYGKGHKRRKGYVKPKEKNYDEEDSEDSPPEEEVL